MLKLEALSQDRLQDFISYCQKHKKYIDESFLYDEDLRKFTINEESPTYILIDDQGKLIATASLLIDDYHKRGRRGRFRIFHSEVNDQGYYKSLMEAIKTHTEGLDKVFIYIPTNNIDLIKSFESLNFQVERYSFLLVREDVDNLDCQFPEGYYLKAFRKGIDEEAWCSIRNAAFSNLKGSETPMTQEMVSKMLKQEDYIEGGLMLLYHGDRPIAIVRGSDDNYEELPIMNIGPLAVMPEYQGRGLGRMLLRAALKVAKCKGYDRTVLCVNAENEHARKLYLQEGFKQVEAVACYNYYLKN